MERFIARYADRIIGTLSGFDRLVFRGTLRSIAFVVGMLGFMRARAIPLKNFDLWAGGLTKRVEEAALRAARTFDCPIQYVASSRTDKDALAREIARKNGVQEGLVCVLTCVEPCMSFEVYRNADEKCLELIARERKCTFIYHYAIDPVVGWMNARIQTWAPFSIQICINGREWLARDLDRSGIAYRRDDNCFPWIQNIAEAQRLMDRQLQVCWPQMLQGIARRLNPDHTRLSPELHDYYWSVYQSEWASDIMFKDPQSLAQIYPALVRYGITAFSSQDVMRFLGQKPRWNLQQEIRSSFKDRTEGVRIKHWVGHNSIKLYDKAGSILRPETTIQYPDPFKVFRAKEGDPNGPQSWLRMRSGIADLARRAEVSQLANDRYMEAMTAADTSTPLGALVQCVTVPLTWKGRPARGLRPWDTRDLQLFRAANDGRWCVHGFRNRDLQRELFEGDAATPEEKRRRSARVSRLIRLLRAHGLVRKEPGARRYTVTRRGREIMTAILSAQTVTLEQLRKTA